MGRIPVIKIEDVLIATLLEGVRDADVLDLQTDVGEALERSGAGGVLFDFSVVETVDSFLGRMLTETATLARLLGARAVVVGIQPAVALTLVELGLTLEGVDAALTVEKGMALIRREHRNGAR